MHLFICRKILQIAAQVVFRTGLEDLKPFSEHKRYVPAFLGDLFVEKEGGLGLGTYKQPSVELCN